MYVLLNSPQVSKVISSAIFLIVTHSTQLGTKRATVIKRVVCMCN